MDVTWGCCNHQSHTSQPIRDRAQPSRPGHWWQGRPKQPPARATEASAMATKQLIRHWPQQPQWKNVTCFQEGHPNPPCILPKAGSGYLDTEVLIVLVMGLISELLFNPITTVLLLPLPTLPHRHIPRVTFSTAKDNQTSQERKTHHLHPPSISQSSWPHVLPCSSHLAFQWDTSRNSDTSLSPPVRQV